MSVVEAGEPGGERLAIDHVDRYGIDVGALGAAGLGHGVQPFGITAGQAQRITGASSASAWPMPLEAPVMTMLAKVCVMR